MKEGDNLKGLELLTVATYNTSFVVCPTLIYDEKDFILIDCGYPGTYDELKKALNQFNTSVKDLTYLIITHHDIDHIGNMHAIVEENPNIRILASYIEEPYLTGCELPIKLSSIDYKKNLDEVVESLPSPKQEIVKEALLHLSVPKVTAIHDNELLPFCGGIKVIFTPGHTPGHICLYLERYKTLVSGDELNVVDGKLMGPKPEYTQDIKKAIESLSKFKKYDIECVHCFHGGIYKDQPKSRIVQISTSDVV